MTMLTESFTKETPARQMGALASSLGRIASSAEKTARVNAIIPMLDECLQFIEWTASHQTPAASKELQDISVMLKLWRDAWEHAQTDERLRRLLSVQARKWSDLALEYSGLLIQT
ncbi:MAG: hypothetical protein MHPDNHAH_01243 [Anaerolineales bacterium]|nr:hypothetical protein [Anaerolineales bacterium]